MAILIVKSIHGCQMSGQNCTVFLGVIARTESVLIFLDLYSEKRISAFLELL